MSARKPILQVVRDSARRARNILKLTDPHEIAAYCLKECKTLGMVTEEFILDSLIQAMIKLTTMRVQPKRNESDRQLHLFANCEDIVYDIRHVDGVVQKALADFDEDDIDQVEEQQDQNISEVIAARDLFRRAAGFVRPLLEKNPDWVWRDAVGYLQAHGGLPTL